MKTLYLECNTGVTCDMLVAALSELLDDTKAFEEKMNSIGMDGITFELKKTESAGVRGTSADIRKEPRQDKTEEESQYLYPDEIDDDNEPKRSFFGFRKKQEEVREEPKRSRGPHRTHRNLGDVISIIDELSLPGRVRKNAIEIYNIIANAHGNVSGQAFEEVYLHEAGRRDVISYIVGICILIDELDVDTVIASNICVGTGYTQTSQGFVPVPTPAVSSILKGITTCAGKIEGELCTASGAAVIKKFVSDFGTMPPMSVKKIGYGIGKKRSSSLVCIRAFLGEIENRSANGEAVELVCNLDDSTPEMIGYVQDLLLKKGAYDVYTTPIYMKKNRPGVKLSCLCSSDDADDFAMIMIKNTTTIGVRRMNYMRYTMASEIEERETSYGVVRVKKSSGYNMTKTKLEYDDVSRIAFENDMPYDETCKRIWDELNGNS